MTLRERRVAFSAAVVELLAKFPKHAWSDASWIVEFAFDEGTIHSPRRVRNADGSTATMDDAVHIRTSRHYDGLALDLLVFINGVYITDGSHPVWVEIDAMAKAVDPRLGLGLHFHDANHLSWEEGQ